MTSSRDPDRLIHAFLLDGAEQLQDRVYDAVRAEIEHKPQRVVIGPWRMPTLSKLVPIGLGIAAVVAVLVVGSRLFGPPTAGVGGPGEEPTPTLEPTNIATPGPTPTATAAESTEPTPGPLPEGPFVLVYEQLFGVRTTVTIPAPDWHGLQYDTGIEKHGMAGPPQGAGLVVYGGDMLVYGDPCAWESTRPDDPATSLDDFVAALSAQASRDATPPVDVTVGGYPGRMLTLHVPEDAEFTDCDGGEFRTLMEVSSSGDEAPRFHQGPGQIDEVWVVDVDGTLVFFDAAYFAATPAEYVEEMRTMIESATFETP